jgi:hypothetical protein
VLQQYTIDASNLDENTYYRITMYLPTGRITTMQVIVALNSGTTPSWSTHVAGYSCRVHWTSIGSGWGTNTVNRRLLEYSYDFANSNPIGSIEQLLHNSMEYIYVRGGGRYYFYTNNGVIPILQTSTYEGLNGQTVSPSSSIKTDYITVYDEFAVRGVTRGKVDTPIGGVNQIPYDLPNIASLHVPGFEYSAALTMLDYTGYPLQLRLRGSPGYEEEVSFRSANRDEWRRLAFADEIPAQFGAVSGSNITFPNNVYAKAFYVN